MKKTETTTSKVKSIQDIIAVINYVKEQKLSGQPIDPDKLRGLKLDLVI